MLSAVVEMDALSNDAWEELMVAVQKKAKKGNSTLPDTDGFTWGPEGEGGSAGAGICIVLCADGKVKACSDDPVRSFCVFTNYNGTFKARCILFSVGFIIFSKHLYQSTSFHFFC